MAKVVRIGTGIRADIVFDHKYILDPEEVSRQVRRHSVLIITKSVIVAMPVSDVVSAFHMTPQPDAVFEGFLLRARDGLRKSADDQNEDDTFHKHTSESEIDAALADERSVNRLWNFRVRTYANRNYVVNTKSPFRIREIW